MENIFSKSKLFVTIDGKYEAETTKKHCTTVDKVREELVEIFWPEYSLAFSFSFFQVISFGNRLVFFSSSEYVAIQHSLCDVCLCFVNKTSLKFRKTSAERIASYRKFVNSCRSLVAFLSSFSSCKQCTSCEKTGSSQVYARGIFGNFPLTLSKVHIGTIIQS